MAKVFYENKFIMTKKLHRQYCKVSYRKMRKGTMIMAFCISILCLILSAFFLIYLRMPKATTVAFVLFLYFLMMAFWGYGFSEWLNYRQLQRQHGQAIAMVIDFMPVQISVRVNKASFTFKYSSIYKAYETPDMIVLVLGTKGSVEHGQALYKRGFGEGVELNDFKRFINEKAEKKIFDIEEDNTEFIQNITD